MGFKKGHKLARGRPKGSKNRNAKIADKIVEIGLKNGERDFQKIWDALKPKEKADMILKFLPFEKAQYARIEEKGKLQPTININMIAATKENVKQLDNTINVEHEEIDD